MVLDLLGIVFALFCGLHLAALSWLEWRIGSSGVIRLVNYCGRSRHGLNLGHLDAFVDCMLGDGARIDRFACHVTVEINLHLLYAFRSIPIVRADAAVVLALAVRKTRTSSEHRLRLLWLILPASIRFDAFLRQKLTSVVHGIRVRLV